MTQPEQVGTTDLVRGIRSYMARVEHGGETFVVTHYGLPVAILAPYVEPPETPASSSAPGDSGAPSLGLADRWGTVSAITVIAEEEAAAL